LKLLFSQITILLIIPACFLSAKDKSMIALNSAFDPSVWIGAQEEPHIHDSLLYNDNPAPLFRKKFMVNRNIKSATVSPINSVLV
jgi:hypothetical protein